MIIEYYTLEKIIGMNSEMRAEERNWEDVQEGLYHFSMPWDDGDKRLYLRFVMLEKEKYGMVHSWVQNEKEWKQEQGGLIKSD